MARAYGFRVFIVEAYPNRIKGKEPYSAASGSPLVDEIALLLGRIEAKGTHRFEPRPDSDGNVDKPVKTATLSSWMRVRSDLIHAQIAVGEEGSHASATKPKRKPRDMAGWSPEAAHEVTFVFPKGKESRFFLVTQTSHRRDPHSRLLAMLREESMLVRTEREAEEKQARASARANGETVPKKRDFSRLLFKDQQASDNEYLDELITGADGASVMFKSKKLDTVGNTSYVDRELKIKLRNQNIIDVARTAGRSWVSKWRGGKQPTQREAVTEVAGLLEERDLLAEGEESRYESTAISIHGKESGTSTTIAVDTLRDAFTYPISDLPPSHATYYTRISERVSKIARQENIEIVPIDPNEVLQCLSDSTPTGS